MTVLRQIAAECRADRVLALVILGLGAWSAIALAILAFTVLDGLPAS
ncbi:hypothetical protein ABEV34_04315 [Methylorubrum rhodesianum]|nr:MULTISPECIES: hypothetical protein [Methylorubrum]MBB5764169.1 hypothetical protein [Methylorubrum rhodesianum]MBK3405360.1 hypothetical protein [Methylorubrum rhodesianum]MBY0141888.1 hypothetical protein [Methylorubrum populi]